MDMKTENPNIFKPSGEMRDLKLLEALEKNPIVSQRELSHKFGIALGVTNACLKRMVRKGWIRIRDLNRRKIEYCLTPKGFTEKARLTLHLVSCTIHNYVELKKIISQRLLEMQRRGGQRIVFYGISEEMEVAYITLQGTNLKLAGIVEDDEKITPRFLFGYELEPVSRVNELKPDAILITSSQENEKKKERLRTICEGRNVFVRDICL